MINLAIQILRRSIRKITEMEFDISYTSKEITPWGGMVFLKQMLQKIGFRDLIDQNTDLPQSGSNRGYKTSTIIESFITSIWSQWLLNLRGQFYDALLKVLILFFLTPRQECYFLI